MNKSPLFFFSIILVTSLFVISTYADLGPYYVDGGEGINSGCVWMIKHSNDQYVCVFYTSVEKLIQREYAYPYGPARDRCNDYETYTNKNIKCHISNHPRFLIKEGLSDSIHFTVSGDNEVDPPQIFGRGYFESEDTIYKFEWGYHHYRLMFFRIL